MDLRRHALELRAELATSARVLKCVASRRTEEPPTKNGRYANPLESVAASLRDAGKNYSRSTRKGFAGTIVETRSRTEEGRSHEQPVKLYEVAVNGLLRVSHQVKRAVNGLTMFQKFGFWANGVRQARWRSTRKHPRSLFRLMSVRLGPPRRTLRPQSCRKSGNNGKTTKKSPARARPPGKKPEGWGGWGGVI